MLSQQMMRTNFSATAQRFGFGPEVMKKIRVCRVCGCSCTAQEKYCRDCGAILPKETLFDLYKAQHLYCTACDTVVSGSAVFCPECGKRLRPKRFGIFG
ncbi:MAG: hypothetical protein IJC39_01340 [Firmicutes bacterium]|nr:hypothetical protein [Bacillota bacterium]